MWESKAGEQLCQLIATAAAALKWKKRSVTAVAKFIVVHSTEIFSFRSFSFSSSFSLSLFLSFSLSLLLSFSLSLFLSFSLSFSLSCFEFKKRKHLFDNVAVNREPFKFAWVLLFLPKCFFQSWLIKDGVG